MTSKCIPNIARSRPPCESLSSHHLGLPVHLQTCSIPASQCMSKLDQTWLSSASLSSHDLGVQVHLQTSSIMAFKSISKLVHLRPPQVHLHTRFITISDCFCMFASSRPPSVSPNMLDYAPQVVLKTVPFSDSFYYSGSMKTQTWPVRSGFVPNGSHN
jgi:hypothetical protein